MKTYGKVHVETAVDAESFAALMGTLSLQPPVLIKPNWGTVECYTESQVLDWALSSIPGDKLVIESHGWARNEETLLGTDPGRLTKANLRRGERWFLGYSHTDEVLRKHGVEYLNLTEEIWAGRAADPVRVRQVVEEKFEPLQDDELYTKVPARLFELRGGTLLSLSKFKVVFQPLGVSFSIKNLFGLIPGPSRSKYHGKAHARLDQSIVDINKVYRSLFAVKGVVEAVQSAGTLEKEGQRTQVHPGRQIAFASADTVSLDAFAAVIGGRSPDGVGHLRCAAQTFGPWDPQACAEAVHSGIKIV